MITEAFLQCAGIGPARLAKLQQAGVRSWLDAVHAPERIPSRWREPLLEESQRSLRALQEDDIAYFVDRFHAIDKWRIVAHYCDATSFFDIETTGLEYDARITVISCWHRGQLLTFVEHENLDDFLELLDDVSLLASFNGSTFDVPRLLDAFHIPQLPCPHVDLRWACYHRGWRGGLKKIARLAGIDRPLDIADADGSLAVQLWLLWEHQGDQAARDRLIRYCAADVLLLLQLTRLWAQRPLSLEELWRHLPAEPNGKTPQIAEAAGASPGHSPSDGPPAFGTASPLKLRAWRPLAG